MGLWACRQERYMHLERVERNPKQHAAHHLPPDHDGRCTVKGEDLQ